MERRHTLADGGEVLIRPLLYGDRFELAARFSDLSLESRRFRFFQAPEVLDEAELEYLTNIEYEDHFACVPRLVRGDTMEGIGVGRYVRDRHDPTIAEVAVTVVDEEQRRGVGTLLARMLAEVAAAHGVRTFVSYVQWENVSAIEPLAEEGARILPDEPGIARIEIDLPERVDERTGNQMRRALAAFATRMRAFRLGSRPDG
jgi:GNAT superfamily N-acetyltransferase